MWRAACTVDIFRRMAAAQQKARIAALRRGAGCSLALAAQPLALARQDGFPVGLVVGGRPRLERLRIGRVALRGRRGLAEQAAAGLGLAAGAAAGLTPGL